MRRSEGVLFRYPISVLSGADNDAQERLCHHVVVAKHQILNEYIMSAREDLRGPKAQWSVGLMKRLYHERPRFCDVAIECIPARHADGREDTPEQNVVYAHRAVLAARTSCAPRLSQ